ncbi:MAG: hypothetical protein ACFB3T_13435 [Geminicoccaceae bacterium]
MGVAWLAGATGAAADEAAVLRLNKASPQASAAVMDTAETGGESRIDRIARILAKADPEVSAKILEGLSPASSAYLMSKIGERQQVAILSTLPVNVAQDILLKMVNP